MSLVLITFHADLRGLANKMQNWFVDKLEQGYISQSSLLGEILVTKKSQ